MRANTVENQSVIPERHYLEQPIYYTLDILDILDRVSEVKTYYQMKRWAFRERRIGFLSNVLGTPTPLHAIIVLSHLVIHPAPIRSPQSCKSCSPSSKSEIYVLNLPQNWLPLSQLKGIGALSTKPSSCFGQNFPPNQVCRFVGFLQLWATPPLGQSGFVSKTSCYFFTIFWAEGISDAIWQHHDAAIMLLRG